MSQHQTKALAGNEIIVHAASKTKTQGGNIRPYSCSWPDSRASLQTFESHIL